jgi:hypothetical protein
MKILRYLHIAAVLTLTAACNDLNLEPAGFITTGQFYTTIANAEAGLNGIYSSLVYEPGEQSLYGRNLYFLTDMAADYAAAGASAIKPDVRSISASSIASTNDRVALAWKQIYKGINLANVAIDKIPDITGQEESKQRLINEAKFLRALLYFDAVQLWGDVPLVLHEVSSLKEVKVPRTPKEQVYEQIIADLKDAERLPDVAAVVKGHPAHGAASALLAKVYLVRKEWAKAEAKAKEVINSGEYALEPKFADLFDPAKKNGVEHIFSFQFEDGQSGTTGNAGNTLPAAGFTGFTNAVQPADIISDAKLFYEDLFENEDERKHVSYAKTLYNPATKEEFTFNIPVFRKFVDTTLIAAGRGQNASAVNNPVIRYADVLLILAEAINEQRQNDTEAYNAFNQVRRRAYNQPLNEPSPVDLRSGQSHDEFLAAIQNERLKEFVQEGQRWFDLVRWHILLESLHKVPEKANAPERNYLFPIPQVQHDLDPEGLWQNPGY